MNIIAAQATVLAAAQQARRDSGSHSTTPNSITCAEVMEKNKNSMLKDITEYF